VSRPLQRDALRVIQDIVTEATGAPLQGEAERRLESVLQALAAGDSPAPLHSPYSHREVTILFADLRGFSAIASAYPTEVVLGVLNRCFGMMTEIIVRHYGTIDKFMGDAIMAIFAGDPAVPRDHAQRALLCAVEMQIAMTELREQHKGEKVPEVYLGIGISTGKVMAGLIGSEAYRAHTVIGEEVNLASRIEAFSLRGQVLMSEVTYAHCRDFVDAGEPMDIYVKGRSEQLRIREALGIPGLGKVVPRQEVRKSPRAAVTLAFEYRLLQNKVVMPEAIRGVARDIGYHGLQAEVDRSLPLYAEIKLDLELSSVGHRADDVYARVVRITPQAGGYLAGIEFTSLGAESSSKIRLFVQTLIQDQIKLDPASSCASSP
jgi:adenylate cyclase